MPLVILPSPYNQVVSIDCKKASCKEKQVQQMEQDYPFPCLPASLFQMSLSNIKH